MRMLKRHFIVLLCLATLSPAHSTEYLDPKWGWDTCIRLLPSFMKKLVARKGVAKPWGPGPYHPDHHGSRFPTDKPVTLYRFGAPRVHSDFQRHQEPHIHRLKGKVVKETNEWVELALTEDGVEVDRYLRVIHEVPRRNAAVQEALEKQGWATSDGPYDLHKGKTIRVWKIATDSLTIVNESIVYWEVEAP